MRKIRSSRFFTEKSLSCFSGGTRNFISQFYNILGTRIIFANRQAKMISTLADSACR